MSNIDDLDQDFCAWLSGFADGEGSFTVRITKEGTVQPSFSITLRDDDRFILEEIKARLLPHSKVKAQSEFTNKWGVRSNPKAHFEVRGWRDCLYVLPIFDRFPLRAKKAKDYALWREIVLACAVMPKGDRWHGKPDRSHIYEMVERLREGRKYVVSA